MAKQFACTGWEIDNPFFVLSAGGGAKATALWDPTKARTGNGYMKVSAVNGEMSLTGNFANQPALLIANGEEGQLEVRCFFRVVDLPGLRMPLWSAITTTTAYSGVALNTNGTLECFHMPSGVYSAGTASTLAVEECGDDLDKWYELLLQIYVKQVSHLDVPNDDTILITATLTAPDGTSEVITRGPILGNISPQLGFPVLIRFLFAGNTTYDIDFDDVAVSFGTGVDFGTTALPDEKQVLFAPITGQGSEAEWSGDWRLASRTRLGSGSALHQLATGVGFRTTFTHKSAADLGITSVGAIDVHALLTTASTVATKFRLGGVTYDGAMTSGTNFSHNLFGMRYGALMPLTPEEFDALEWGMESNNAGYNRLFGCQAEVLCTAEAPSPPTGGYRHKFVEWTGDASADGFHEITGVGFEPHFVIAWPINGSGAATTMKLAQTPANYAYRHATFAAEDFISIDADGFTVGFDLMESGIHYIALCVRDDGDGAGGRVFASGHMAKYSAAVQSEVLNFGADFQPTTLFIGPDVLYWYFAEMGTLTVPISSTNGTPTANLVSSLDSNGFTLGTALFDTWNAQDPVGMPWFAWRIGDSLAGLIQQGEIPPSDSDVVQALDDGLAPYFVVAHGNKQSTTPKRFDEAEFSGTLCNSWGGQTINLANALTAIDSAGGTFTVKGNAVLLDASPAVECWWMAFAIEAEILPPSEVVFSDDAAVGLTWIELTDSAGDLKVWSNIALPDPASYYGGFKEARVNTFGTIRRALSDDLGEYEGTSFSFTLDDTDRMLRQMLDDVATRYFPNRAVVVRTITDALRRVQEIPRTILRGLVARYRPSPKLLFDFTVHDSLASLFSAGDTGHIPKRLITLENFPNCPQAAGSGAGATVKTWTTPHASIAIPPCPDYVQISDQAQIINMSGAVSNGEYANPNPNPNCATRGWIMYDSAGQGIQTGWVGHVPPVPGDVTFASADVAQALEAAAGGETTDLVCLSLPVPIIYGTITDKNLGASASGQGQAPVLYVGAYELSDGREYHKFVVAGHACKLIDGIYGCDGAQGVGTFPASSVGDLAVQAGLGADWVVPGYANWTALMGPDLFEDINGDRFTTIYGLVGNLAADVGSGFKEPLTESSIPLSVSVQGIETVGDGTGTLITDLLSQYLHALQNWVLGDYRSGDWLDSPMYSDDPTLAQIDDASFATASLVAQRRVAGGYRGDFIIGSSIPGRSSTAAENLAAADRVTVRELVKRFNMSADVNSGFNRKGQFMVSMIDDADFDVASVMRITDGVNVHLNSFDVFDDQDHHWNVVPFRHTRDYFLREPDGWRSIQSGDQELEDEFSINHYGPTGQSLRIVAPTLGLFMIRGKNRNTDAEEYVQGSLTAADVAGRFLMRHKDPPRIATFQLGLSGHNTDLGDVIRMTHYAGIGTGGWVDRPLRVLRHEAAPGEHTVDITAFDMQVLFATGFILGDETALPDLWPDASQSERFYGYLGDETTGLFTTGQPMKRVR